MPGRSELDHGLQTGRSDVDNQSSSASPGNHQGGGFWPVKGRGKRDAQGICFSWPGWGGNGGTTGGGCRFETPWIFKTLTNVGILAFDNLKQQRRDSTSHNWEQSLRLPGTHLFPLQDAASISKGPFFDQFLPHLKAGIMKFNPWGKEAPTASISKDELGELEERALAQALAMRKPATIIEFYSPRCTLCRSLVSVVTEVERRNKDWLQIVMLDVENKRWLAEVLLYDIKYVPCFLLLDSRGNALVKTGVPYSRKHVLQGLSYILESVKPIKNRVKYVEKVPGDNLNSSQTCGGEFKKS